ncbi:MAG TPA: hypothetical protein VLM79_03890 [Kofleriaceae bacterium]|nr:hypothetical protein [Kofleriaceae bacterium]
MAPSAKMRLEAALARWRHTRASGDAASVYETAMIALDGWQRPVTGSARAFQRAWLAAVPDPIGRAWALDNLFEQLPGDDATRRAGALAKRVEALARHAPDPRFTPAIARIHGWRDATPRLRSALDRLVTLSQPQPLAAPAVHRELPPLSRETEALWRELHASPDDDAPRFWHLTTITLGVGGGLRRALGRWSGMPRAMSLTLVPDATATPITAAFPWDFAVTLTRDDDATIARISGEWLLLPVDVLAALPPETIRVEVDHANPAMVDRVRGAIGRPGVEVVHRPQLRLAAVFTPTSDRAR